MYTKIGREREDGEGERVRVGEWGREKRENKRERVGRKRERG